MEDQCVVRFFPYVSCSCTIFICLVSAAWSSTAIWLESSGTNWRWRPSLQRPPLCLTWSVNWESKDTLSQDSHNGTTLQHSDKDTLLEHSDKDTPFQHSDKDIPLEHSYKDTPYKHSYKNTLLETFRQGHIIGTFRQGHIIGTFRQGHTIGTFRQEHTIGTFRQGHTIGTFRLGHTIPALIQGHTIGTFRQGHTIGTFSLLLLLLSLLRQIPSSPHECRCMLHGCEVVIHHFLFIHLLDRPMNTVACSTAVMFRHSTS